MTCNHETASRGVFVAEAIDNRQLCREHFRLVVRADRFPPSRPGQFVQVQCRPLDEPAGAHEVDWSADSPPALTQPELTEREPMLRRPLSLADRRDLADGGVELEFIYRVVGAGTHWLGEVRPGQKLSLLGPLGNGFTIREAKPAAVLIGGGVGIPPMIYLAHALAAAGKTVVAFSGVREASLLPLSLACDAVVHDQAKPSACVSEFAALGIPSVVATDDGSLGYHGFVSNALGEWIERTKPWPDDLVAYCCGPEALMKATADVCGAHGIECQLALERHMACGMGTCQSCIVKIRDDSAQGWSFKLCCTDGPVFNARDVLW